MSLPPAIAVASTSWPMRFSNATPLPTDFDSAAQSMGWAILIDRSPAWEDSGTTVACATISPWLFMTYPREPGQSARSSQHFHRRWRGSTAGCSGPMPKIRWRNADTAPASSGDVALNSNLLIGIEFHRGPETWNSHSKYAYRGDPASTTA